MVTLFVDSPECSEAKFKDITELQQAVAYTIEDRSTEEGGKKYEKAMPNLKNYVASTRRQRNGGTACG